MILFTTCRCYRELASPAAGGSPAGGSSPPKPRHPATTASCSSSSHDVAAAAAAAGGGACKGEFDPLVETVKAARSCSTIITNLLTFPRPPPCGPLPPPVGGGGGETTRSTHECLTLSARASMAMDMASSTAFGQAVREALVRSPCRELRVNAMAMLASLSRIDREIAAQVEAYGGEGGGGGGGSGGFISQTTVMVRSWFVCKCWAAGGGSGGGGRVGKYLRFQRSRAVLGFSGRDEKPPRVHAYACRPRRRGAHTPPQWLVFGEFVYT